jgi:uncharacterized protein
VGYRRELNAWLSTIPAEVELIELTAEHFFNSKFRIKPRPLKHFPCVVHALGLSLGTPGPLDRAYLDEFCRVVKALNPLWISEHAAFTRTQEVDLGHLNPIAPTFENIAIISDHIHEVQERTGKRLLLENIASHLLIEGELSEPEFLNRICERSGCGLLLDITNLYVNAKNHGYDLAHWLSQLNLEEVKQMHIVGYSRKGQRLEDTHSDAIQEELMSLATDLLTRCSMDAVIIERDWNFPAWQSLASELQRLKYATIAH